MSHQIYKINKKELEKWLSNPALSTTTKKDLEQLLASSKEESDQIELQLSRSHKKQSYVVLNGIKKSFKLNLN